MEASGFGAVFQVKGNHLVEQVARSRGLLAGCGSGGFEGAEFRNGLGFNPRIQFGTLGGRHRWEMRYPLQPLLMGLLALLPALFELGEAAPDSAAHGWTPVVGRPVMMIRGQPGL
ncbi:hypothetical protein AEGHOMDF_4242 [Methylobacterium soli]|nr:hypothetical protein AEGHOMDF_4242 [Methylobacterium soli]